MSDHRRTPGRRGIARAVPGVIGVAGIALLVAGAALARGAPRALAVAGDARVRGPVETGPDLVTVRSDATRPASDAGFASGRASFSVGFRDLVIPYRAFLATASPGERVQLRVIPGGESGRHDTGTARPRHDFVAAPSAGEMVRLGPLSWVWKAPATSGHYSVEVSDRTTGERVTLSAAVLVPMSRLQRGAVSGYRVGTFPGTPYRGLAQYERPAGFLLLEPEHAEIPVSPHFTLGQFPAKGPPGWPKYLVLSERLLLKLELLLEEANRRGIQAPTFEVLSGFRSPWYNGSIGRPTYSRHIYGDAADIYVDVDRDGRMDDLNGDGRVDLRDAGLLYDIVEGMDGAEETSHLLGGLGKYPTTSTHGPFVHVDTRLYRARW